MQSNFNSKTILGMSTPNTRERDNRCITKNEMLEKQSMYSKLCITQLRVRRMMKK